MLSTCVFYIADYVFFKEAQTFWSKLYSQIPSNVVVIDFYFLLSLLCVYHKNVPHKDINLLVFPVVYSVLVTNIKYRSKESIVSHNNVRIISWNLLSYMFRLTY
jgi:hypothetical protein